VNNDKVFRAIGDIDEDLIDRAAPKDKAKRAVYASQLKWALPVAACLALTVLIVPNLFRSSVEPPYVDLPAPEIGPPGELAIVPPWDDMTITQKFRTVMFNGIEYTVSTVLFDPSGSEFGTLEISPSEITGLIGVATSGGYGDHNENTINCEIYSLRSISSECAIAVKYEGHDGYYPFKNPYYLPETLGDLIDGLNLRENLVFNRVHYDYFEDDTYNTYIASVYTLPDYSVIWDLLLADTSAKNEAEIMNTVSVMDISIDVKVIGYRNISLSVNDSGYLQTNILDTGKSFYIGEDTVRAFVDYVLSNGSGTIVYRSDWEMKQDGPNLE
jgi:hypothetical protein